MSWLKVREAGAEGKLRLASLLNVLFGLAGSGDQSHTVVEAESFLSIHLHTTLMTWVSSQTGLTAVHQSQCSWKGSLQQQLHSVSQIFYMATHLPVT